MNKRVLNNKKIMYLTIRTLQTTLCGLMHARDKPICSTCYKMTAITHEARMYKNVQIMIGLQNG